MTGSPERCCRARCSRSGQFCQEGSCGIRRWMRPVPETSRRPDLTAPPSIQPRPRRPQGRRDRREMSPGQLLHERPRGASIRRPRQSAPNARGHVAAGCEAARIELLIRRDRVIDAQIGAMPLRGRQAGEASLCELGVTCPVMMIGPAAACSSRSIQGRTSARLLQVLCRDSPAAGDRSLRDASGTTTSIR